MNENNKEKDEKKNRLGLSIKAEYIDAFMLHDIFIMADKDRDGVLNFNELSYAFKLLGFDFNGEDIKSVLVDRNLLIKEKKFIPMVVDLMEKDKLHAENIIQTFKMITNAAYDKGKNTKYMDTRKFLSLLCEGEFEYMTNLTYEEGNALCNLLAEDIVEEVDMYRLTNTLLNIENTQSLQDSSSLSTIDEINAEQDKNKGDSTNANIGPNNQRMDQENRYSNSFVSSFLKSIEEDEQGNILNEEKVRSSLDCSGRLSLGKSISRESQSETLSDIVNFDSKEAEKAFFMDSLLLHVTGLDKKDTTKSMYFKNMLLSPKRISTVLSRVEV